MMYFHPHTMRRDVAAEHVPYLDALRGAHVTWSAALRHWLADRIHCEEAKRYVSNFMVMTRARPDANDSDDGRPAQ